MESRRIMWLAALALGLLAGCGGGGGSVAAPEGAGSASGAGLQLAKSGDLVAYVRDRIQQGAERGQSLVTIGGIGAVPAPVAVAAGGVQAADGLQGQAPAQEAGVEEDDLLKSDGRTVYALHPWASFESPVRPASVTTHRINADGSLSDLATVTLAAEHRTPGMYLTADAATLAVLGETHQVVDPFVIAPTLTIWPYRPTLRLDVFDTAGAAPAARHSVEIQGALAGSRMVGNVLYIASTWVPDLSRYAVPAGSSAAQVRAALAGLTAQELLPTIRLDGAAAQPLVNEPECLVQPGNASASLQLTTITAIDLGSPDLQRSSRCFVGGTSSLYMTAESVYLASSQSYGDEVFIATLLPRFPAETRTDIHKFALQGTQVDYRGTGRVQGHLGWDREKSPYRLSEHQGLLRVLSFTGQTGWFGPVGTTQQGAPSPATLTVLREDAASRSLVPVATLPNERRPAALGKPGEQVYAVRFAGDRAYLVTFRQVDPLYVLDLSDPLDPKVAGELSLPGYSDYLFPLADGKLLGVGKDATDAGLMQGIKVGLFDVANAAQPRVLSSFSLGVRGTTSGLDYSRHGISLLAQGNRVRAGLPVRVYDGEVTTQSVRASYQGLLRFDIDTAAGTLVRQPTVIATEFDGTAADSIRLARFNLANERSLLTPNATYYLTGGQLRSIPQP